MAPTLASKPKICLRLDVHSNHHQTACVYDEPSLLTAVPQFQSFEILCGIIQRENFVSPCDYRMRIHVTERSRVLFIHDFRGCGVSVEIFDRRSDVYEGGSISDQLDKVYLTLVVQILQELMAVPWYRFLGDCGIKWLLQDICSAMNQKRAGKMREELFAPFFRSEVNRAVVLSDVALKRISSLQYPMHKENLVTSLERVRGSGLASLGLSVGAHESIINPMTNSDGALDSAAMDKNRAGKRKEELFGPKDNLAVGLSDITFTGHGGGLALQGYAVMHQSTNPLTNPGFYHSPEAIQRRDRGSGLANSQVGAILEDNCPVLEERQKIATAPILASMRKICLQLDVHSKHHQTACVYEESSLLALLFSTGPRPLFQSFTIMQGMLQRGRGASPISYRIETSGSERSRVSFLHDFGGCGVCVVIFDRRDAIHEGGSIVSELDKAYLPLVVQVLQKVMEISRSVVGGSLLKQYIGSGKDEYSALTMRAELDRLCRSEANLAAETALGLSDVALIHNHSLQYCMPKENLVTSLVSCHSSAAVQMDRGSRLVLQGGARMHQSTNPVTNPELYHSYAAIQRRDRGSGLDSQGPSSDGGFKGPVLLGGTGIKLETSPESYDSSSAIQRATRMLAFHVLFDLVLERVSWLAFQELYDAALERESRRLSSNSCVICESAFADENCTVEVSEDLGPSSDGGFKGPALLGGTGINLVASPESYDSSAAIQRDRGLFDFMKPRTNRETSYSPAAIQMVGGSRLASHGRHNSDLAGVGLQGGARMHQSTNPVTNPELYHSYAAIQRRDRGSALDSQGPLSDGGFKGPALLGGTGISLVASSESDDSSAAIQRARSSRLVIQRRDRGSGLANSQGLSDSTPLEGQVLQGADDNVHRTHPMKWFDSLGSAGKAIYSALASLGVSDDALEDLESQGNAIPVSERIYYMLSEHNQSVQQWLRDAGTVGAGFSAVYASPSLATQLPAAVAFISVLTAMWLPRKCRRTKIILTKFGAIASIASVMSAMIKHLSPVGMGIAGALLLIPSGVVVFG